MAARRTPPLRHGDPRPRPDRGTVDRIGSSSLLPPPPSPLGSTHPRPPCPRPRASTAPRLKDLPQGPSSWSRSGSPQAGPRAPRRPRLGLRALPSLALWRGRPRPFAARKSDWNQSEQRSGNRCAWLLRPGPSTCLPGDLPASGSCIRVCDGAIGAPEAPQARSGWGTGPGRSGPNYGCSKVEVAEDLSGAALGRPPGPAPACEGHAPSHPPTTRRQPVTSGRAPAPGLPPPSPPSPPAPGGPISASGSRGSGAARPRSLPVPLRLWNPPPPRRPSPPRAARPLRAPVLQAGAPGPDPAAQGTRRDSPALRPRAPSPVGSGPAP